MPLHPRPHPPDRARRPASQRTTTNNDAESPLLLRIETRTNDLRHPTVPADLLTPIGVPGTLTPDGSLTMAELRGPLLEATTSPQVRDHVWRYVIDQVRAQHADGPYTHDPRHDWHMFALGLATPGLKAQAYILAPEGSPGWWIKRVHSDIAANFVTRILTIDTTAGRVLFRLLRQTREATSHRGRGSAHTDERDRILVELDDYLTLIATAGPREIDRLTYSEHGGHPLLALARLVQATQDQPDGKRLTVYDARLIAYTQLGGGHTIAQAAAILGLSEPTARGRHNRARHLIRTLLSTPAPRP